MRKILFLAFFGYGLAGQAQIEMNSSGNVTIGTYSGSSLKLNVIGKTKFAVLDANFT